MNGPCCSCLSITYTAAPTGDGFVRDCWSCDSCGCEFVRRPIQADTAQTAVEIEGVDIFEDQSKAVCEHGQLRRVCDACESTATLAARDAEIVKLKECVEHFSQAAIDRLHEIERLKDKAIRFDLDQIGIESRERDAVELVEARAEIERLKAELSLAQFDATTDRAAAVQLGELVEKRERQLVWALRACSDDEALKFYGLDIIALSDDDAGLLAAIDEAYSSRPDRDQRRHQPD